MSRSILAAPALSGCKLTKVGTIGVDSGQVLICDPCYIKKEKWSDEFVKDSKPDALTYAGCCGATLSKERMGAVGAFPGEAFASSTAYGDGEYPIFKVTDYRDEFVGLFIDFTGVVEELEDDEDEPITVDGCPESIDSDPGL